MPDDHSSDCALHNAPAYAPAPCNCLPTADMCRAAVEYLNGPEVYSKLPAEALAIEESIYAEVWKAMNAAAPAESLPIGPDELKTRLGNIHHYADKLRAQAGAETDEEGWANRILFGVERLRKRLGLD